MSPTSGQRRAGERGGWPPRPAPRRLLAALALCLPLLAAGSVRGATAPALTPPDEGVLAEARAIVQRMIAAERGPYSRIRWYCADGAVLPPEPYACRDHGGGRQHAEYSPDRARLAALGWSVGTIVAALSYDELWDAGRRQQRLRELALERYLVEVEDGWVLRRAGAYRGRVQVEDEERAGRELLERLLAQRDWVASSFLLAREAVRTLPHSTGGDRTRAVRRQAEELAAADPTFAALRAKIHGSPGVEDVAATRRWIETARRRAADPALVARAEELARDLEALYAGGGEAVAAALAGLGRRAPRAELELLLADAAAQPPAERLARLARAMGRIRELVATSADGALNLRLLDLSLAVEPEVGKAAFELLAAPGAARRELAAWAGDLLAAVHGAGLLSSREWGAVAEPLAALGRAATAPTTGYVAAVAGLRRVSGWALGTVRYTFAEPLARYGALDERAARFPDDLVRGSALLPLAEVATRLTADADRLSGVHHRVFGQGRDGLLGLNPGVAVGRLRLVGGADKTPLGRQDVAVLAETLSELPPVAGILSLAEGNLLSHVQILARNLGIPNASLTPDLAGELARHEGEEVLLAVASDGSIVLERLADLPAPVVAELRGRAQREEVAAGRVEAPLPDLARRDPLPLAALDAGLSGRVVGPKAANLGELARHFPGRVAPAVALPFGTFAAHVSAGADSPRVRLERAFAAHRAGALDDAGLARAVEEVRQAIAALTLSPALRATLVPLLARELGAPGSYGAFIRSDTNVEDLPGFTGAGLNLTIPNVVGLEAQLAAVPKVWASAFSARAMAWRSRVLTRPEEVYTSVLIMKSVPSEKSGVLVTTDLATRGAGLTVATAWGVGGAVDGEAAETLVLRPGGDVLLVGEAKAPYSRRLAAAGGLEWVSAAAGAVLTAAEQQALRDLAREVDEQLEPARDADGRALPWDVEFAFVGGEVSLLQIRPLVERGQMRADRLVAGLEPERPAVPLLTRLDEPAAPREAGR